jgi:large subunit ribosomal protein L6
MFANTIAAHLKNMFKGVVEGYNAKVKVLSGHFPITPAVEGSVVSVKNFLGEKTPRKVTMPAGVKVVLQGDTFVVDGADREIVAQAAAKIENMTRITDKDRRVFQDGCYIIQKAANKKI